MTRYVALLRAVNLGGHNSLPMTELKAMCQRAGFSNVQTYIASGNVVFDAASDERRVKAALEAELEAFAGKRIEALVRTEGELAAVLAANPYRAMRPDRTVAIFLDHAPSADALDSISGQKDEEVSLGTREIYVHYGEGMGRSRLKIKAAADGTARNVNTIMRLAALAASAA